MPDPSLYTILGTLGGAALGATSAVVGPMLLHRRQARERRAQEARLEQREQEQAQRDDEWRRREHQLEIDRDSQRNHEALTRRLINMRATTRDFQEFLTKTFRALVGGEEIGLDDFENGLNAVQAALNSAFDEALLDGLWFAHAREANFLNPQTVVRGGVRKGVGVDATDLGSRLMDTAHLVRQCVKNGPPIPDDARTQAEQALLEVTVARDSLVAYIKGRLDAHGTSR